MRTAIPLLLLAACAADRSTRAPEVTVPGAWTREASGASGPAERWWEEFGDATLDGLVERATAEAGGSRELALARARVMEARAFRDAAEGGTQPRLEGVASYARTRSSGNTAQGQLVPAREHDLWQAGFDASFELDLFGRNDAAVDAARAGLEASGEDLRAIRWTLVAEVAREYVELRGLQAELAVARSNLAAQEETEALTRARAEAGLSDRLDHVRAQAQAAATRAALPDLEAQSAGNLHRLEVLLGTTPGTLAAELGPHAPVPVPPPRIAAGLPSELLRRRPDVRRAEHEVAQAAALSAAAAAELMPRLTLSGSLLQHSIRGADLLDGASTSWSIGPALLAPLFEGGRLRANLRAADARTEQALVRYEAAVLQALAEVETALAGLARARERLAALEQAAGAGGEAATLARQLHEAGLVDFLALLDAERSRLQAEAELARGRAALAARAVALWKALGAG